MSVPDTSRREKACKKDYLKDLYKKWFQFRTWLHLCGNE